MATFMEAHVGSGTADGTLFISSTVYIFSSRPPTRVISGYLAALSGKCNQPRMSWQIPDNAQVLSS